MQGRLALAMLGLTFCGCGDRRTMDASAERRGAPPPPPASVSVGSCDQPFRDSLSAAAFPSKVGTLCAVPATTAYGKAADKPIHDICDVFDGECEIYLGLGIDREVELRYAGGTASLAVHYSRFDTSDHAYAMFTKRVVGDSDPALDSTPQPFALEGAHAGTAALGAGSSILVKGAQLVEITYNDNKLDEASLDRAAGATLPDLIRSVAAKLPGGEEPRAVTLLPSDDRLPMGVRLLDADLLGEKGAGSGAFGYHKTKSGARYRSLVAVRDDVARAKATFEALRHGGSALSGIGDDAVRVEKHEGPLTLEWVLARKDSQIVGIGDESRVLRGGMPEKDRAELCLSLDEKKAKLGAMVAGSR